MAQGDLAARDLAGIGVGFGGPVDSRLGIVLKSHQVEGWDSFPLREWLASELGAPVALGNDSDLAGLAEALLGAGRGCSPVVYMNIGSGIGGALVLGGELYTGQGRGAAEIGHLRIAPDEPGLPWRTLESVASGWSLAASALSASRERPESLLSKLAGDDPERLTTETLVQAVRSRDPVAEAIWRSAIEYLGVAVANVMTLLNPECFVLGGGVALVGDPLFEPLRLEVQRQSFAPYAGSWRIVPAALGEEVVLHGAILLAQRVRETGI